MLSIPCGAKRNRVRRNTELRTFSRVADVVAGQQEGDRFLRDLLEFQAAPDALATRVSEISGDHSRLIGFCRAIQKFIERVAP